MKALFFLLIACFSSVVTVIAQDDDTIQFKHGLPETVEDTSQVGQDFTPTDSFVEIAPEQVPQGLFRHLNDEPQFSGWQDQLIALDKNTGYYWLKMTDTESKVRTYVFTAKGVLVSLRETERKE